MLSSGRGPLGDRPVWEASNHPPKVAQKHAHETSAASRKAALTTAWRRVSSGATVQLRAASRASALGPAPLGIHEAAADGSRHSHGGGSAGAAAGAAADARSPASLAAKPRGAEAARPPAALPSLDTSRTVDSGRREGMRELVAGRVGTKV